MSLSIPGKVRADTLIGLTSEGAHPASLHYRHHYIFACQSSRVFLIWRITTNFVSERTNEEQNYQSADTLSAGCSRSIAAPHPQRRSPGSAMKKKMLRLAEVARVLAMSEANLKAAAADPVIRDKSGEPYLPEDLALMLAREMKKRRAATPPQQMTPQQEENAARVYQTNATREFFTAAFGAPFVHLDAPGAGGRGGALRQTCRTQERGGDAIALHSRDERRRSCCRGAGSSIWGASE